MSAPRRANGEVHILAMLDGLGARPQSKRMLAWCCAAGALACALLGTLAWLGRAPGARNSAEIVATELPAPRPIGAASEAGASPDTAPHLAAAPPAPAVRAAGATIVNLPEAERAPSVPTGATHPVPLAPPHPQPGDPLARAPASRTVQHAPAPRAAPAGVHPPAPRATPRHAAGAPKPAPAAVDTDVALITAIIQHAAKQREAAQENGCNDKPCGPRMPPDP